MEVRSKSLKWAVLAIAFALLIALPPARLVLFAISPYRPGTPTEKFLMIRKGQNPNEITRILYQEGVIGDPKKFLWVGRLGRQWKNIKAGEYRFSPNMSPVEIFATLTSGISAARPITVREGENLYEIAAELAAKQIADKNKFVELCQNSTFIRTLPWFEKDPNAPKTLEGYLFPDTYYLNRSMTESEMIRAMVRHFFENWNSKYEERAKELGLSRHQVVTLASIIEKETGAPEERPVISSVFHNRLKKRMRLQSDPTTIYGMWNHYQGKIHKKDLSERNLYNTYMIAGLPVGPISNPGKESIHAALHPVQSAYLYFVSHNDGTHEFTQTFEDHNRAVRKFQLDPKARAGKSWRDYNKKKLLNGQAPKDSLKQLE